MIYLEILFWEIPGSAYTKAMCRRLNIPSDKINSYEIILIFFLYIMFILLVDLLQVFVIDQGRQNSKDVTRSQRYAFR